MLHTFLTLAFILAVFAGVLSLFEKKLIYFPYKYPAGNWDVRGYGVEVEDVYFKSGDGVKLHGWYVPARDAQADLLWFHGNAGNITHRMDNLLSLLELGLNVFIFDYRGYGRSEGKPDEAGLYMDSLSAYDYLIAQKKVDPARLFLFGRSLGGVCAAVTATQRPSAGLILESTFTSARDMAGRMFPILPMRYLVRSRFDAQKAVASVNIPKLFLHGTRDEIVPYSLGRKLYESAPQPKLFYDIQGAGHNDTYFVGGQPYFNQIGSFVKETLTDFPAPENKTPSD